MQIVMDAEGGCEIGGGGGVEEGGGGGGGGMQEGRPYFRCSRYHVCANLCVCVNVCVRNSSCVSFLCCDFLGGLSEPNKVTQYVENTFLSHVFIVTKSVWRLL